MLLTGNPPIPPSLRLRFNGHPPLGVNATASILSMQTIIICDEFQRAPTLGGECYRRETEQRRDNHGLGFNGHPPLGVNATTLPSAFWTLSYASFNGHPPLGVNATRPQSKPCCTSDSFNGHPPLGVNATGVIFVQSYGSSRAFNGHPPLGVNATHLPNWVRCS